MCDNKKVKDVSSDEQEGLGPAANRDSGDPDKEDQASDAGRLKPVRPRIGESTDNLKQRSEWFQKRSGKE